MKRAAADEDFPRGGAAAASADAADGSKRPKKRAIALPRLDAQVRVVAVCARACADWLICGWRACIRADGGVFALARCVNCLCVAAGRRRGGRGQQAADVRGAAEVQGAPRALASGVLRRCGAAAPQRAADGCVRRALLAHTHARAPPCAAQSLSVGTKLWGTVAEVGTRRLVVSLPSGLRGVVRAAEVRAVRMPSRRLHTAVVRMRAAPPSSNLALTLLPQASDVHAEHLRAGGAAARGVRRGGGNDSDASDDDGGSDGDDDDDAAGAAAGGARDPSAPPPLPAQFAVGQLVRCVVISLGADQDSGGGGKKKGSKTHADAPSGAPKRVDLSLRLSRVVGASLRLETLHAARALPATVRSCEDHGYVLSFGPSDISGFLLRKHVPAGSNLAPGAHIETVVSAVDAPRRVVSVTAAPAAVAAAALSDADDVSLDALLPGALVPARVRAVLADGLQMSFLTYFTARARPIHAHSRLNLPFLTSNKRIALFFLIQGTVDWFHLDNLFPLPSALGGAYAPGAKCKARVLWVDAATKRVGLTLRRPLVDLSPPPRLPPLGARAPGATVRRVDPAIGLLLALPAAEGGDASGDAAASAPCAAYVHISNVSDARVEKLEKNFKRGAEVDARVIGCVRHTHSFTRVMLASSLIHVVPIAPARA
jgi:rRNA biogenesis protein RRP5